MSTDIKDLKSAVYDILEQQGQLAAANQELENRKAEIVKRIQELKAKSTEDKKEG